MKYLHIIHTYTIKSIHFQMILLKTQTFKPVYTSLHNLSTTRLANHHRQIDKKSNF